MARTFDGATDRIDYTSTWNEQGEPFSMACWVYADTSGGSIYGYFYHHGDTNTTFGIAVFLYDRNAIKFARPGDTEFNRRTDTDTFTAGTLTHLAVTCLGDISDNTKAHIYINGSEPAYNSSQNGVAEQSYDADDWSIGGRNYDDARNLIGYMSEYATWNRALSVGEVVSLSKGYSPLLFPNNIMAYAPLVRLSQDLISGDGGTLDGTTVSAHTPVIYPAPPHIITTPSAVGETLSINIGQDQAAYLDSGLRVWPTP